MNSRTLALLALLGSVWAAHALSPLLCYEPLSDAKNPNAARVYESRSTVLPERVVRWQVQYFSSLDLPDGSRQATLKTTALASAVFPSSRQEVYVMDPRGVFTPSGTGDPPDPTEYGPTALLPAQPELQQVDRVWRFEGRRCVPFAFTVLLPTGRNTDPTATTGSYHVLSIGPLEVGQDKFDHAIQVTGVERLSLSLGDILNDQLLLRCRRWYVRGIGLVQEIIQFPDYPSLGRLETLLTSHPGLAPEPLEAKAN